MSGFVALQQPGSLLMAMVPLIMRTLQIPGAMLVSESHAATGGLLIWGSHTTLWGHGDIQTRAAAEDHV